MHDSGEYSISDLADLISVSRPTVYRTLGRQKSATDDRQLASQESGDKIHR